MTDHVSKRELRDAVARLTLGFFGILAFAVLVFVMFAK